jgi:hypothetical protein
MLFAEFGIPIAVVAVLAQRGIHEATDIQLRALSDALPRGRSTRSSHGPPAHRGGTRALRLSRYFGTSERFWLNLQA